MTTREIRKDKNNKLSKKQCIMFLTEYEKLLKNEIEGVINPITNNAPVRDEKRLNYIVKYCHRTFAYDDNEKKIIEGHINTWDEFTVNIDSYEQIMTLLLIPFKVGYRIEFIQQLFLQQDNLDEKTALYLLEKYINENKKNKYIKCYLEVVKEIKKTIKDFHFSMKNEELYNIVYNTDILDIELITKKLPQQYYFELLVLSKNIEELRKNLCDNLPKYIVLRYFNLLLRQILYKYNETDRNIALVNYLYIISIYCLETGNIGFKVNYDSLSLSFSSTESTHSSGTSSNKKEKQLYLDNILSYDGINEVDPFSQKKWQKMNLQTLKTVIIIEYQENGKTFRNAFNAKDLYKQWKIAIKNNKPFVNPYTRKPFTVEDTQMIVDKLKTIYPRIVEPVVRTLRRRDIELSRYNLDENTVVYTLYFRIEDYDQYNFEPFSKTIELLTIVLPIYIDTEEYEYHFGFINDKIIHLFNTNKITGKTLPFKVHPAFLKYNKKDKLTMTQYKNFCNML
jgi:hypothetical protein